MRQISFRLPHDPRPFVMSITLDCRFGQGASTHLWPRGKGNKSQEEKGDRAPTEEDFGEAMQCSSSSQAGSTMM